MEQQLNYEVRYTMKHLILLIFLLSSFIAYGQNPDLIVTTGGDSLKCKIVEVNAGEIQFRFDTGSIIAIPRSDVASHQYNYVPAAQSNKEDTPVKITDIQEEKIENKKYPKFYVGGVIGFRDCSEVKVQHWKIESGTMLDSGLEFAYFFLPTIGAGIKINLGMRFNVGAIEYNETVFFSGLALYGRFGKPGKRAAFTPSVGAGMLGWTWNSTDGASDGFSSGFGGFLSPGFNFMLTRQFGIGLNMQIYIGVVEDRYGNKRDEGDNIGASLGLNVRF